MKFQPMLASSKGDQLTLADEGYSYEQKADGIRCLTDFEAGGPQLWSRDGNLKNQQFPEIREALWALPYKVGTTLDGEIVAIDEEGRLTDFQLLQARVHLLDPSRRPVRVAYAVFDILQDGPVDCRQEPLRKRKERLRPLAATNATVRLLPCSADGALLLGQAKNERWEGFIAKRLDSTYQCGARNANWIKLKFAKRQEFVIGGWTEPTGSREHIGAFILGVYKGGVLEYAGKVGTGFALYQLGELKRRLEEYATRTCPFGKTGPRLDVERPHWIAPHYLAEVRFINWTWEGKLRHPVYLGLRSDKHPRFVKREAS